ncbi:Uma2 family endonuclease [Actinokineospora sp.]|uniref:Uma2 family endonuclease n=1 Tax=Actinokineospora sp. TaxID=1872133 RepID=UPI00403793A3
MPAPHQAESSAPTHLLTIAEYAALGETEFGYTELLEGRLLMSPSPTYRHNRAAFKLNSQLDAQLPEHLLVIQDLDVDLEFGPPGGPGFSRRPDLMILHADAVDRLDAEGGILRASEVLVVVEIISPGSRRTDRVTKHGEYADAGIPHYWLVDTDTPISLIAYHHTEEFGYQNDNEATGTFTTTIPFPVTIDLNALG